MEIHKGFIVSNKFNFFAEITIFWLWNAWFFCQGPDLAKFLKTLNPFMLKLIMNV